MNGRFLGGLTLLLLLLALFVKMQSNEWDTAMALLLVLELAALIYIKGAS